MTTIPIGAIDIGQRSRSEIRNIESLAESIREHSLLHPPVVRRENERWVLVCGERRLAAMCSLGWTETPVTVAETISDELAALYAEGDENTEREPFTPVEAEGHQRRIWDAEERAAAERRRRAAAETAAQRERDAASRFVPNPSPEPASGNFPEAGSGDQSATEREPAHKRETRERTAKATGYSGKSLAKVKRVLDVAADEAQPAPVREIAQQAAENLNQPGAKIDREYKVVQQAINDQQLAEAEGSLTDALDDRVPGWRTTVDRARLRARWSKAIAGAADIPLMDPEAVASVLSEAEVTAAQLTISGCAQWMTQLNEARKPTLRVMDGGRS